MSFLRPNISSTGRVIRGVLAIVMGLGAALTWPHSQAASIALTGASVFVAFEAARGWCAARACGVRTKF